MQKITRVFIAGWLIILPILFNNCGKGGSRSALLEDTAAANPYTKDGALFVDDMGLRPAQLKTLEGYEEEILSVSKAGVDLSDAGTTPWKNGVVPYVFDKNLTAGQKKLILSAMQMWMDVSQLQFVPFIKHSTYVYFTSAEKGRCLTDILGQPPAKWETFTTVNLGEARCWNKGVIAHEIGHVLGMMHEHMHPHAEKYIYINMKNVREDRRGNFPKLRKVQTDSVGKTYDFKSIMHYPYNHSAIDPDIPTIRPLLKYMKYIGFMGRDEVFQELSPQDKEYVREIYGYKAERKKERRTQYVKNFSCKTKNTTCSAKFNCNEGHKIVQVKAVCDLGSQSLTRPEADSYYYDTISVMKPAGGDYTKGACWVGNTKINQYGKPLRVTNTDTFTYGCKGAAYNNDGEDCQIAGQAVCEI